MTVVAQHHPEPFVPAALERAGVPYEIRRTGSARVAERNLREVAGRAGGAVPGRPVPAAVA
ncbi:hypothetical protein [Nonomuraea sp. NPDC046570]|uniref:hypothetical protein n=1 Tax=Nonomuraea sp. NPDC046570 TaxID=3155255 RepID=UPI0033D86C80